MPTESQVGVSPCSPFPPQPPSPPPLHSFQLLLLPKANLWLQTSISQSCMAPLTSQPSQDLLVIPQLLNAPRVTLPLWQWRHQCYPLAEDNPLMSTSPTAGSCVACGSPQMPEPPLCCHLCPRAEESLHSWSPES